MQKRVFTLSLLLYSLPPQFRKFATPVTSPRHLVCLRTCTLLMFCLLSSFNFLTQASVWCIDVNGHSYSSCQFVMNTDFRCRTLSIICTNCGSQVDELATLLHCLLFLIHLFRRLASLEVYRRCIQLTTLWSSLWSVFLVTLPVVHQLKMLLSISDSWLFPSSEWNEIQKMEGNSGYVQSPPLTYDSAIGSTCVFQ